MGGTCQPEVHGGVESLLLRESLDTVEEGVSTCLAQEACWVGVACAVGSIVASSGGRHEEEEAHDPCAGGVAWVEAYEG